MGAISSLTLFGLYSQSFLVIGGLGLLLGVSLGFGMPTCMGYYTDSVPIEKRGRVSGITLLVSGIGIFAFSILFQISDALTLGIVLAAWRLLSTIIFLSVLSPNIAVQKSNFSSYRLIFSQQSFILYFVPWVMFSLVNYLVAPVQAPLEGGTSEILMLVQTGFMGFFAVLGGFFLDSVGRKRIAIAGFAMLGLGTAVAGVFPSSMPSLYFNAAIDGIAWGFLLILFILTLWGDLSYSSSSDKYYALGVLPFFVSKFLELTVGPYIALVVKPSALFSYTAFFLFLAVLPLFYASETLPEKGIKERELQSYLENAKKFKEKHS